MSSNKTCRMSSELNIKGIEHFTDSWKDLMLQLLLPAPEKHAKMEAVARKAVRTMAGFMPTATSTRGPTTNPSQNAAPASRAYLHDAAYSRVTSGMASPALVSPQQMIGILCTEWTCTECRMCPPPVDVVCRWLRQREPGHADDSAYHTKEPS